MHHATYEHQLFGRLGEPSRPLSQAEDSTQTSGFEKNARHGPTASADPGAPSGLHRLDVSNDG